MRNSNIKIIPIPIFNDNYIWLLIDSKLAKAICVDPGTANEVIHYLKQNQLELDTILITHHHPDHIDGIDTLIKQYPNCKIYTPNEPRITPSTINVDNNQEIKIQDLNLTCKVISTPGHTSSHICYFFDLDNPLLFSGDTLFSGGCGRLFEGTAKQMLSSLKSLAALPGKTKVFCAHEYTRSNLDFYQSLNTNNLDLNNYINKLNNNKHILSLPSTIEQELKINPFLRCATDEFKKSFSRQINSLSELDIFTHLRTLKDNF